MVEKLRIDGFQALKVIIAVFIPRSILPVLEVIIHRDWMGLQAVSRQLDRKPVRKGRFSGGRGACDHDDLLAGICCDSSCNLSDLSFLIGLLNEDQLSDIFLHKVIVHISNGGDSKKFTPVKRLLLHLKKLLLRLEFTDLFRCFRSGSSSTKPSSKRRSLK